MLLLMSFDVIEPALDTVALLSMVTAAPVPPGVIDPPLAIVTFPAVEVASGVVVAPPTVVSASAGVAIRPKATVER